MSAPVPLYRSDWATLYAADAREILPTLARDSVDVLVTDPPYGVSYQSEYRGEAFAIMAGDDGSLNVPDVLALAIRALRNHRHVYVFGYGADVLAEPMRLSSTAELIWDKAFPGMGDLNQPWSHSHETITFGVYRTSAFDRRANRGRLVARLRQGSVIREQRVARGAATARHPTEKPVALMRQLIESSSTLSETVLDPFAGCGSTLVAAILAGRRAVGIEIDAGYAATAVARIRKAEAIANESERT